MDKPILVVIDMQGQFASANNPRTIAGCQKLIVNASLNTHPIMFVEYMGYGETLPQLTQLVGAFEPKFRIHKTKDDGSEAVQETIKRCKVKPKKFIVCGVNTGFCVLSTVIGLHAASSQYHIDVVAEACNDQWGDSEPSFALMRKMPRVQVI